MAFVFFTNNWLTEESKCYRADKWFRLFLSVACLRRLEPSSHRSSWTSTTTSSGGNKSTCQRDSAVQTLFQLITVQCQKHDSN